MHMAFDELGDHDAAWKALERACQAKRRLLEYDPADSLRLVDALMAMPAGPAPDAAIPAATKTPIFIVGMHRSGKTLLEQLLDASPQVRGVGELYDFTSAIDRKSTSLNSSHYCASRMPSPA